MRQGIYYQRQDYASFSRRLAVTAVDLIVALLFWIAAMAVIAVIAVMLPVGNWFPEITIVSALLVWYGYFVILKGSRFRTLGYRLGRVALVQLDGQPVHRGTLLLRASFVALGPLNFIGDLTFVWDDRHRQTLRDKIAKTYMIRAGAQPAGRGRVSCRLWEICHYNLLVSDVEVEEDRRVGAAAAR